MGTVSIIVVSFAVNHFASRVASEPQYIAPQARLVNPVERPQSTPVDEVVAAEVAAVVAEETDLLVVPNVTNRAITLDAQATMAAQIDQSATPSVEKPQVIAQADESVQGIITITTKAGDTIAGLAVQYNISQDTIRWANDLVADTLEPGTQLKILPVSGVLHTVRQGETVNGLAASYNVSANQISAYNDTELKGLKPGAQVIIPGGKKAVAEPSLDTPVGSGIDFGPSSVDTSMTAVFAGNRYDYGYCTWYVYNRRAEIGRPVPSFLGNGSAWAFNAARSGYVVNNQPKVGAVFQTAAGYGGYGHVAFVESVHPNGSITISEMNYAGWNVKSTRTISASQVSSYNYIH